MGVLCFLRQFKQILFTTLVLLVGITALSQVKPKVAALHQEAPKLISPYRREFLRLATDANVVFNFPSGFREILPPNDDYFSFDYAMETSGHQFEIWFKVSSQKNDWKNYLTMRNDPGRQLPNPDTGYLAKGRAIAKTLADDTVSVTRTIDQEVLKRYNASAGKSYLVDMPYRAATKHYKYALVLAIEKDHIGTVLMVCFTDEKSPEFFRNVNRISHYLKFKS
ncbi:hypothetical protein [Mucilaginibacter sp.]|jgi:hypothetical protein|uniref:hypothetical protein n=1 Tax=Mucilaginibacter sp. TaxID=1882438 RepID=UPI002BE21301|nr:hypothetical protein [Mucilaginibacter sp.]HTI61173.1 hypothetical protein [Mucilaginibacter sp.]